MSRVLLVDDDIELCEMLNEYLCGEGFEVTVTYDGESGVEQAITNHYDVILLDVMLPKLNGFDALRAIRLKSETPVLMLTARGDDIDRIVGLEMGADDYLPKPYNPRELVARLRAILRRTHSKTSADTHISNEPLQVGEIEIHPASRGVLKNGKPLELTSTEYNLLEILIRHAGHVVSKETLSLEALGRKLTRYDRSVDMHLSKLRKKLGTGPNDQPLIKTVRGMGCQFVKE
ncbi:response regulator [Pseudomonadota bacterium]